MNPYQLTCREINALYALIADRSKVSKEFYSDIMNAIAALEKIKTYL